MTPTVQQENLPARQDQPTMLDIIREVACNPSADVGKLERLLAMQQQIHAEEAKTAFFADFKNACEEMRPVVRDAQNQHTKTRYALLETIDRAIRPIYTRHGFSLTFNSPVTDAAGVTVACTVFHERGHSKEYQLSGALDGAGAKGSSNKTDIQALGSTVTYLRRYLECMIFNVVLTNEDSDGNGEGKKKPTFISQEQGDNIESLIADVGMDGAAVTNFLKIMEAPDVRHIKADRYRQATMLLEARRGRR